MESRRGDEERRRGEERRREQRKELVWLLCDVVFGTVQSRRAEEREERRAM